AVDGAFVLTVRVLLILLNGGPARGCGPAARLRVRGAFEVTAPKHVRFRGVQIRSPAAGERRVCGHGADASYRVSRCRLGSVDTKGRRTAAPYSRRWPSRVSD